MSAADARSLRSLRVGFAGTPDFAAKALQALIGADATIPLVLTQPDRPKGRGLASAASPVKALALAHGLAVAQPASLRHDDAAFATLGGAALDVLVVAAYGLILPRRVLDLPRHGCLNIHASLLPRWRGAAPIARAILEGDAESGVTIMRMDEGLDTGAIVDMRRTPLAPRETAATLLARLAEMGAGAIVDVLAKLAAGEPLASTPQPAAGVVHAAKLSREDARVDWRRDAAAIDRAIRAFDPWPVAWATLGGETLKLWRAEPQVHDAVRPSAAHAPDATAARIVPGQIVAISAEGIDVACGHGLLRLAEVQPANARRMAAAAFATGQHLHAGARFDDAAHAHRAAGA